MLTFSKTHTKFDFPPEIEMKILSWCDLKIILKCELVCKRFLNIIRNHFEGNQIWFFLYKKTFPPNPYGVKALSTDYKKNIYNFFYWRKRFVSTFMFQNSFKCINKKNDKLSKAHKDHVWGANFSPCGRFFSTCGRIEKGQGWEGVVGLWNLSWEDSKSSTEIIVRKIYEFSLSEPVRTAVFSPKSDYLLCLQNYKETVLNIWNYSKFGKRFENRSLLTIHSHPIWIDDCSFLSSSFDFVEIEKRKFQQINLFRFENREKNGNDAYLFFFELDNGELENILILMGKYKRNIYFLCGQNVVRKIPLKVFEKKESDFGKKLNIEFVPKACFVDYQVNNSRIFKRFFSFIDNKIIFQQYPEYSSDVSDLDPFNPVIKVFCLKSKQVVMQLEGQKCFSNYYLLINSFSRIEGEKFISSGSMCSSLFIWNEYGSEIIKIKAHDSISCNGVYFHPKFPIALTIGDDKRVKLWKFDILNDFIVNGKKKVRLKFKKWKKKMKMGVSVKDDQLSKPNKDFSQG